MKSPDSKSALSSNYSAKKDPIIKKYLLLWIINMITKLVLRTPLTPNMVTGLSFMLPVAAAWLYMTGVPKNLVFAGILTLFYYLFDCVDGQIARIKGVSTPWGDFFDSITNRLAVMMLLLGVTYGLYVQTANSLVWILGFIAVSTFYFNETVQWFSEKKSKLTLRETFAKEVGVLSKVAAQMGINTKNLRIGYGGDLIFTVFTIGGIFNQLSFILWFFIITLNLLMVWTFIKTFRWYGKR